MAHQLVQLERDQERGRDDRQVLGPELVEPQSRSLDQLEQPVPECEQRGDAYLRRVQVVEVDDDPVQEWA